MNSISCECHLEADRQPCPGHGGDFVCPPMRSSSPPIVSSDSSCSSGVEGDCELSESSNDTLQAGSSRVINLCRLFEEKIRSSERLNSDSRKKFNKSKKLRERKEIEETKSDETIVLRMDPDPVNPLDVDDEYDPRYFTSHTKIVSIPNGVKIITTIFSDDQTIQTVDQNTVYETLIYPESEIIKKFEQDVYSKRQRDQKTLKSR